MHATCRRIMQSLPSRTEKKRWTYAGACVFCCRTAAISAPFTPPARSVSSHCQPLQPMIAILDVTSHCNSRRWSRHCLAISMLANLDVRRSHCCSQVSKLANLDVGSHNMQQLQQGQVAAGGNAMQTTPSHYTPGIV